MQFYASHGFQKDERLLCGHAVVIKTHQQAIEQGAAPDRLQLRSSFLLTALPAAGELVEKALWAANQIHWVEMHRELWPLYSTQQTQVAIRRVGINPRHCCQCVERALGLYGVYDLWNGIDDEIECLLGEISRMWPVPLLASGTGDINTTASANSLDQS